MTKFGDQQYPPLDKNGSDKNGERLYNRYSKLFVHPGKAIAVVNGIGKSASLALICRILGT